MQSNRRILLRAFATAALLSLTAGAKADTVQVSGSLSGAHTWHATNEYVLSGKVYVLSNAVLRIEPGTVIKGKPGGENDASALFVCQSGKIYAEGTPENPIIFTAEADDVTDPGDLGIYARGLWGGVVILGNATINQAADAAGNTASPKYDVYEGLSDLQINGQYVHRFGGSNDDDDSGVLRYVSIRHGGVRLLPNKEINGLSLGGVGRSTVIDHVEAYAIADDGFEFFGGTVNTKYLVSAFCDDDAFDADMGYNGKNQFWLAIQERGAKDNGAEFNGEINGTVTGNYRPIANYEVYNATWIGAGTNTAGNRALQLRDYAAPRIYNSILTEFGGYGVRVDAASASHLTNGLLDLRDNLWWNFATNGVALPQVWETAQAAVLFETARSNEVVNPMLRGTGRTNEPAYGLDPRPAVGSPALTSNRTAPNDGFYSPVGYKGAFDSQNLWITKWTALDAYGFVPQRSSSVVNVSGNIEGNVQWCFTNEYVLSGKVYVLSNAVLRIEPGTVIKGKPGGETDASALFVCQSSKIYAEGTPENPIIFTAEADDVTDPGDLGIYARGLWGGVVILGNATINQAADASGNTASPKYDVYEGLSDLQINGQYVHRFGGSNDDDDSGVLRYVSIRHGGVRLLPNKEINGLSLGGVGRGTVIDHVEAYAIADDGFEFFGGTVNTKYLVAAFCDDDAFDADMGYNGKNQFWLAIQERGAKDNGAEFNGEINGTVTGNYRPIANYEVYNATWIGAGTNTAGNRALQLRDYAAPRIYNSILTEFGGYGVRVDAAAASHLTNGLLDLRDNLWWNFATNGVALPQVWETAQAAVLFETARSNEVVNPLLRGVSRTNEPAFGLDPRPAVGSPALTSNRTAPNDGFYSPVGYKGAFNHKNWATDWTALGNYGLLSGEGSGQNSQSAITPPAQPDAPALAANVSGGQLVIAFPSQTGFTYQLESSATLQSPQWTAKGAPQAGTGATLTTSASLAEGNRFFRVRAY